MTQEEFIVEKIKEYASNIDSFSIGQEIFDKDKSICIITDKTQTSIEVFIKKKTKKGIDAKQYFDMREFNQRFKI